MKYTTVKISEIRKHPTKRMDAKYWIKKKRKKATSYKQQAWQPVPEMIGWSLELKIMSNAWEKFGPKIFINGEKLQAPSLRIEGSSHKRQASSGKPQVEHN